MAGDVLKQLLLCIQASELYALQLDESTDVEGPGTAPGVRTNQDNMRGYLKNTGQSRCVGMY